LNIELGTLNHMAKEFKVQGKKPKTMNVEVNL
jgi:hypothetical protein